MISCYLIDDDFRSLIILEEYIADLPYLQVVFSSKNPLDFLPKIPGLPEQSIVFLDIDMPELDGIELAKMLPSPTAVIFTTGHPEYAHLSYEIEACDYLVKPFDKTRFLKSIVKVSKKLQAVPLPHAENDYIYLKINKSLQRFYHDEILYFRSSGNYIEVHTSSRQVLVHERLKSLHGQLPEHQFLQISRFCILNIRKVSSIETLEVVVENGERLLLSEKYRDKLVNIFRQFNRQ